MGPFEIVALVVGIVAFNGLMLFGALAWVKRKMVASIAQLTQELSGERVVRGPEAAVYRGASAGRSKVKGTGAAALTATRLVFRPIIGKPIEIARAEIASLREDKWFLRAYSGRMHTILKLNDGSEVGFFFSDPAAWAAALRP